MPFHLALPMEMGINACGVGLYSHMDGTLSVPYIFIIYLCKSLRTNVSMHQTNSSKSLKICGVVFGGNIFYFSRNDFFSLDRSNMQIFTANITQVVWPRVTNILVLRYFCQQNPLFYHLNYLNLNPCHYWSWKSNIFFKWIFLSDILFLRRIVASKQRQF